VALDPRSQGSSEIARTGHEPRRRGRDIAELLDRLGPGRVVLVGWSLGVLDSLAYLAEFGDRRIAGLVLVDNSVGEGQAPPARPSTFLPALRRDRDRTVRAFVRGMYKTPQDPSYLEAVTQASLRTPLQASIELLSYPRPREFWRESVYSTQRPVLYVIRPRLSGQGRLLAEKHADATVEVFEDAGHALFVDEAARFNLLVDEFCMRKARWS
jgi:microsomal epoxide hydrolase